jgi:putative ABC transport system permease protein
VLRAVGAPRGLLSRLVLGEALLIALTACVVGSVMGVHAAKAGQRVNEALLGIRLTGWPPALPTALGWLAVIVITLGAATPAVVALARKPVRELLAAVRG